MISERSLHSKDNKIDILLQNNNEDNDKYFIVLFQWFAQTALQTYSHKWND